jgi:antitoxin ParD1/3/4
MSTLHSIDDQFAAVGRPSHLAQFSTNIFGSTRVIWHVPLVLFQFIYYRDVEELSAITTRNINLTQEMDQFVEAKIQNGEYANASEVLCAGLRALERDEREQQTKLDALREAVTAGIASGIAEEGLSIDFVNESANAQN